ncbi:MAG TPA: LysM peptidoglycan-binding domain-containing protein [Streptosporangiaceae bacterium]|nr:LysM peptidoglycan-binding domain-containing protein [Streptosporangiaceae bacterium]
MSALHAMALPENDPDGRAAAICRAHGRAVHHRAARDRAARDRAPADWTAGSQAPSGRVIRSRTPSGRTARDQAVRSQAARSQAARGQATRAQAARGQTARAQAASVPLRLTRRGRVVIAVAAAILVAGMSLIAAGAVQATNRSVPPGVAEQNLAQVVVRPGQSLWSVAESADPGADTRQVIQQIVELNGLTGDAVAVGQRLWVPRG